MGALDLLRATGALMTVLGLLAGAAWLVRRHGLVLPGIAGRQPRRLAAIERLAIDGRTSLVLIRRDGVEHLLLLAATGASVVEGGIAVPTEAPPLRLAGVALR